MENWKKNFVAELKEKRTTFADMIDFCCDNAILANQLFDTLCNVDGCYYGELYSGSDYDEDTDEYAEIYQYFIVGASDAERLAEYTNEIVYYFEAADVYFLAVTHFGTHWSSVPANWKD